MQKTTNSFKLFLSIFSGEDKSHVRESARSIRIKFALIGSFAILIFFGCLISAYEFSDSLFQGKFFISIPIAVIWALLVVNMYLLLLYTVSPAILPNKKNKNINENTFFSLSMGFRIGFMSLLAIIIAQPLNVLFFSNSIETSLKQHIQEEKTKMVIIADGYLIKNEVAMLKEFNSQLNSKSTNVEITEVNDRISIIRNKVQRDFAFIENAGKLLTKLEHIENQFIISAKDNLKRNQLIFSLSSLVNEEIQSDNDFIGEIENLQIANPNMTNEFEKCKTSLKLAVTSKLNNYNQLDYLLSQTNFYIKRIQLIIFENHWSWLLTTLVCMVFLLPIYFKYKVRDSTDFYSKKIQLETRIVTDEYNAFKKIYSKVLQDNIKNYNFKSLSLLNAELESLRINNINGYSKIHKQARKEYKDEVVSKYEYWADNPFRTITQREQLAVKNNESALVEFLFGNNPEKIT